MEKTNFNKTDASFDETTQMANKWVADTCSVMMDVYNKQLKTMLGFYNNLFSYFSGSNKNEGNYEKDFVPPFLMGNELLKSIFMPFSSFKQNGNLTNVFTSQIEEMYKQIGDFNNRLFTLYQEETKNKQVNWSELSQKYNKIIEEEWKTMQNITTSFLDAYTKQLNYSLELNKKIIQEMNNQFEIAVNRNKKSWSDMVKTNEVHDKQGKEPEADRSKEMQAKKNGKTELVHH